MNKRLIAIGASCLDEYYKMSDKPKLGDKVIIEYLESKVGGMIGNGASVYSSYGTQTYILDYLRDDEDTKLIVKDLEKYGINTEFIEYEEIETKSKCLIMLYEGERIIFVQENSRDQINLSDNQKKFIKESEFIYSTIKDLKRYSNTINLVKELTSTSCKLALDVEPNTLKNLHTDFEILSLASHIFINSFGHKYLKDNYSKDYVKTLLDKGVETIVVTLGEKGCYVYSKNEEFGVDGYKVNVKDTTGAGDTFNSSFLFGLSQGWNLKKCASFANGAAARSVQYLGAKSGAVGTEKVLKFIKNQKGEGNEKN